MKLTLITNQKNNNKTKNKNDSLLLNNLNTIIIPKQRLNIDFILFLNKHKLKD